MLENSTLLFFNYTSKDKININDRSLLLHAKGIIILIKYTMLKYTMFKSFYVDSYDIYKNYMRHDKSDQNKIIGI